jgi:hypothetical protein
MADMHAVGCAVSTSTHGPMLSTEDLISTMLADCHLLQHNPAMQGVITD